MTQIYLPRATEVAQYQQGDRTIAQRFGPLLEGGPGQVVGAPDKSWTRTLSLPNRTAEERDALSAFFAQSNGLRGQFHVPFVRQAMPGLPGEFTTNQLTDGFAEQATDVGAWSIQVSDTLDRLSPYWHLYRADGLATTAMTQSVSFTQGKWAIRGYLQYVNQDGQVSVLTDAGEISASGFMQENGYFCYTVDLGAGDTNPVIAFRGRNGANSGDGFQRVLFAGLQAFRCACVSTASGPLLTIEDLPDADRAFRPGMMLEVVTSEYPLASSLHMITSAGNSISGSTQLSVSPPFKSAPPSGSPVVFHNPGCLMRLDTGNATSFTDLPGRVSDFTVAAIQA